MLAVFLELISRKNLLEQPTPIPQNSIVSGYQSSELGSCVYQQGTDSGSSEEDNEHSS
jgi:hypothetical protein